MRLLPALRHTTVAVADPSASYMAEPRYYFRQPWPPAGHAQPFAQVLVGAAHAGGGIAGIGYP